MSFQDNLSEQERIYIIPRGAIDINNVIQIKPTHGSVRLEVFFPHDQYQVISSNTLKERKCTLNKYIQDTESWRKL